jgi:hypothetical protein
MVLVAIGLALVVVLAVLVGAAWSKGLKHSSGVNDYFGNAARVFSLTRDPAAHAAALAAGKTAASDQRGSMVRYLRALAADLTAAAGDDPEAQEAVARLRQLADEVGAKDWSMSDVIAEKNRLKALDAEYFHALGAADPTVFVRRFPGLF